MSPRPPHYPPVINFVLSTNIYFFCFFNNEFFSQKGFLFLRKTYDSIFFNISHYYSVRRVYDF